MSEKLDVVMEALHSFNGADIEGLLDHCHPDVEMDWSRRLLDPIVTHGHDEARDSTGTMFDSFEKVYFSEPEQVLERGDDVLLVNTGHFTGRTSGIDVEARAATLWTVRDGKVVRFRLYQSLEDALEELPQFRE
jgi:ketosteroid isomerase-like protein